MPRWSSSEGCLAQLLIARSLDCLDGLGSQEVQLSGNIYGNMLCASMCHSFTRCFKMYQDECHEETELYTEVSDQSLCSGCLVSSRLGLVQFCAQTTQDRFVDPNPNISNIPGTKAARDWALDIFGSSKLSQYSGQDYLRGFLNNFYDELEDEAREVEAGALVGLKSHASVLPWHCPEALARAAESKVEEAEHMMEMGLVRPPMIRHVGPQGPHGPQGPQGRHAMESAMEREPSTEDDVEIEEPEEHLILWVGRYQILHWIHDC